MSLQNYRDHQAYRTWRRRQRRALLRLTLVCAAAVALAHLITQPFPPSLL